MSKATNTPMTLRDMRQPPLVEGANGRGGVMDVAMPLHQEAVERIRNERDLKIIITARDSQTGVGKTTMAAWLAMTWQWCFVGESWDADTYSTVHPKDYFKMTSDVPRGTVLVVDDAEELDARRSMQNLNVEFSWKWMLDRYKQLITILTLPSPAAIDKRIEELADVWINVTRRGGGVVHKIGVEDYGSRNVFTKKVHEIQWPDVSGHSELQVMRKQKENKSAQYDLKHADDEEEDDGLDKTQQAFLAAAIYEREDVPWRKVGEQDDRLEYTGEYYRQEYKDTVMQS